MIGAINNDNMHTDVYANIFGIESLRLSELLGGF